VSAGQISEQRARRARIGAAACFLLTGVISASWASRVPAIKDGLGLSDGQFAIALLGLEAGAVLGLQLGGIVVPRTGSRTALIASLLAFLSTLLGPALAPSLLVLAASLFLFAAVNSVVDVAMNAQGVAVQRLMGRPVLSGMHAMHSLGGVLGAGAGALAARLGATPPLHFLVCAVAAVVVGLGAWSLLLPSRVDAKEEQSEGGASYESGLRRWFSGWSVSIAFLGALAFCFTLAEGAGLNWSAVYVTDSLGGTEALGAIGLGVFLGAVTLGRLVGDRLVSRLGPVRVFREGAILAGVGFGGALLETPPCRDWSDWRFSGRASLTRCQSPSPQGAMSQARRRPRPPRECRPSVTSAPSLVPCSWGAWRVCIAYPWRWGCLPYSS
jgi:MFS family permease